LLRPIPSNPNQIQLEWYEKGSDFPFRANSLSDGTIRFICLATLLLQPRLPPLVILDEPELGLHPYAISILYRLLEQASKKSQLLISTQSVTLINYFSPEDVIAVDKEKGSSTFTRLDQLKIEKWMEDYTIGELWEKNIFGGRPQNV
jgi:predicted ATPase